MSKVEFTFSTFPHYFQKHGWLDPKPDGSHMKMAILLLWIFNRCSSETRKVYHDHKEIELGPYEFIFGRAKCAEQTGLGEREVRSRLFWMLEAKIIEKATSKSTSKFTVYKILTEAFSEKTDQQKVQQPTSNRPATDHNKEEEEDKKKKKRESVAAAPAPTQISLRELVTMKVEEFAKLQASIPAQQLEWMLDKLDYYLAKPTTKRAKGASCYSYFRKGGWLLDAWEDHRSKAARSPYGSSATPIIPFFPMMSDEQVDSALVAKIERDQ